MARAISSLPVPLSPEIRIVLLVPEKRFREDLFYRINVIQIRMPPLREKKEDIPRLVQHFLAKYSTLVGKRVEGITDEALACLARYLWPGNVRELENTIERAVVYSRDSTTSRA